MSYILDALRRADAERERGHVPGLHARGTSNDSGGAAPPAWRAGLIGLGAGGALVLLALGIWHIGRADDITATAAAPTPTPTPRVEPSPVPAPAPIEPPTPTAPAAVPPGEAVRPISRAPVTLATTTSRKPTSPTVATSEAARPGTTGVSTVAPSTARATPGVPAASAVSTLAELPDDIRRQLPALAVGGSAYSTSVASRFVIVNGQLFREGDALAPGLVLEQIRLKSAVLAFKGYRYSINF